MALQDHKPLAELPPDPSEDLLQRAAEEAARDLALQAEQQDQLVGGAFTFEQFVPSLIDLI